MKILKNHLESLSIEELRAVRKYAVAKKREKDIAKFFEWLENQFTPERKQVILASVAISIFFLFMHPIAQRYSAEPLIHCFAVVVIAYGLLMWLLYAPARKRNKAHWIGQAPRYQEHKTQPR